MIDKLLVFNAAIVIAGLVMFLFVMTWHERTYTHCKIFRPDILLKEGNPFTFSVTREDMIAPIIGLIAISTCVGFRFVNLHSEIFSYGISGITLVAYFYTQCVFVTRIVRFCDNQ